MSQMMTEKKVNSNTMMKKTMKISLRTQTKTLMLMKLLGFSKLRTFKDNSNSNSSNKEQHIQIKEEQKVGLDI